MAQRRKTWVSCYVQLRVVSITVEGHLMSADDTTDGEQVNNEYEGAEDRPLRITTGDV